MSLFAGTPVTAQTSSQSTTQTPQWLRDAIYNQVQTVQNVAALPFQQAPGATQNQQTAWQQAAQGLNSWQQPANTAIGGLQALTQQPGGMSAAQPLVDQALQSGGGLQAAQPYLQQAGQSSAGGIQNFMNPYNQQVTDRIAQLGARNLTENLLPGVSDAFIQAGQFGGSRMGEFGSRALRDTQEAILGEQAKALQSGFNTALGASESDLARQLQLGQLTGQLGGQQQQVQLEGAGLLGNLANTDRSAQADLYRQLLGGSQQLQQQGIAGRQELANFGEQERQLLYDQYQRAQQYPQQQTNYLTQQLSSLYPMVPSTQVQSSVAPVGANPSTASTLIGGLTGLAGLLS